MVHCTCTYTCSVAGQHAHVHVHVYVIRNRIYMYMYLHSLTTLITVGPREGMEGWVMYCPIHYTLQCLTWGDVHTCTCTCTHHTCIVDLVNSPTDVFSFLPKSSPTCPSFFPSSLPFPPWQPGKQTTGCHTHWWPTGLVHVHVLYVWTPMQYPCKGNKQVHQRVSWTRRHDNSLFHNDTHSLKHYQYTHTRIIHVLNLASRNGQGSREVATTLAR